MSNVMRHKLATIPAITLALIVGHSRAIAQDSEWLVFSSNVITPMPIAYQTEDWSDYKKAEGMAFRGYTFEYPKRWAFTGYSVFEDEKGRKVAEIAPGVIALAKNQHCFESAGQRAHRYKTFRFGAVKGRVIVGDTTFDDSPENFRVYSYCIEQDRYAFTVMFLERKLGPSLAATFRKIIRSFQFAPNDA